MSSPQLIESSADKKAALMQALLRKKALIGPRFPLSFSQERLWFLHQLDPKGIQYNLPMAVRLRGKMHLHALTQAMDTVLRRHESLRTLLASEQGEPFQVVLPFLPAPMLVKTFPGETLAERETQADQFLMREARTPFALEKGPYLRFGLLQLNPEDHWFFITQHHIITDGWSLGILMQELATGYAAALLDKSPPMADLGVQYPDYAKWQRNWLTGDTYARMASFWKELLSQSDQLLDLPLDNPRPSTMDPTGQHVRITLSQEDLAALNAYALAQKASLFMVILSAFGWVLRQFCGQSTVRIGTTVAGRNRSEIEHLMGFFVNTLVLPVSSVPRVTVDQHLQQVRQMTLAAFANQDFPFEALVKELQPERQTSHPPLCQVMFSLQNAPIGGLELPGLQLEPMQANLETVRFDLSLNAVERRDGLSLSLQYRTSLFRQATIQSMLDQLVKTLRQFPLHPKTLLANLPTQASDLSQLNGAAFALEKGSIPALFQSVAALQPDAIALICGRQQLSFQALEQRANQIANLLHSKGLAPETTVGVLLPRCLDMVAAMLGIFKAGATYLPLDTTLPPNRLAYMLSNSQCQLVLTHLDIGTKLLDSSVSLVDIANRLEAFKRPLPLPEPASAAYIIYTSGSTGRPKGVVVSHAGLADHCVSIGQEKSLDARARILQFASFNFDVSLSQLWPGLLRGACIVFRGEEVIDPSTYWQNLSAHQITHSHLTPAYWQACMEHLPPTFTQRSHRLIRMDVGGDRFPSNSLAAWRAAPFGNTCLANSYGPTETIITAATHAIKGEGTTQVHLGQPLPGRNFFVMDGQGNACPRNMPGELWIGGTQLARGYMAAPGLTASHFVPDPFSPKPGARCYRSGDRVRLTQDGLHFLGRIDQQVKLRGYRIELSEITAILEAIPAVSRAVTLLVKSDVDSSIASFAETKLPGEQLRQILENELPSYMVPQHVFTMAQLPLTLNGKLDRQRLVDQLEHISPKTHEGEDFHSPLEALIAGCFAQVLQRPLPHRDAGFFALGGHSLLGLRLIARIAETTGHQLRLQQLFTHPTPAQLATCAQTDAKEECLPPISPHPIQAKAPLSLSQQRLWFLEKLIPGTSLYHMPLAAHLKGSLQPVWLVKSLVALFETYPELLTAIDDHEDEPWQRRIDSTSLPICWLDFSSLTDPLNQVHQHIQTDNSRPFDLAKGPLLRIRVFRIKAQHHVFYLNIHHLLGDGWSIQLFMDNLLANYQDLRMGNAPKTQPPACSYFDYTWWQKNHLQGAYLEAQRDYWRNQFQPLPHPLQLPFDFQPPKVLTHRGASLPFAIDPETCAVLRQFSNSQGLTYFMTLLGVFKVLLYRYTNQTDLVVGTPISNRHHPQTQNIFGLFANTLALRSQLKHQSRLKTFAQFTKELRQTVLEAHQHQDMPFEQIIHQLELQRDASRSPLFQAMFTLTHHEGLTKTAAESPLQIAPIGMKVDQAKFELTLSLVATETGIAGSFEYNTDLFRPTTIAAMAHHFQVLAKQLLQHASLPVSQVPMLSQQQRLLLLAPEKVATKPKEEPFSIQRFEQVVACQPEAPALRLGKLTLSYAALQQKVDQIACMLQSFCVGPEHVVAVAMERGDQWLASMLAVFKTGSIYLPIDPELPSQRRNFMLQDAGAKLLLGLADFQDLPPSVTFLDLRAISHSDPVTSPLPACQPIPEQGAYLIYTSGTTGLPKAVCVSHAAMHHHQHNMLTHYQLTAQDRVMQLCSASFDVSLEEVLPTLLAGACLIMIPNTRELDLKGFIQRIAQEQVSVVNAPTALWHAWVEAMAHGEATMPACLRLQIVGTEAPNPKLLDQWRNQLNHTVTWINAYGPTEATVTATLFQLNSDETNPSHHLPIGRPLDGMATYLLGDQLQPMPTPSKGWLFLSGPQLARGYWGKPAQTANAFLPDPFSQIPGARMYQTGDRCWRQADSQGSAQLVFAGRQDHQVKIRGHRIELEEVNHCLAQAPEVTQSLVILFNPQKQPRLVAYVVMPIRQSLRHSQAGLTQHLQAHLPSYMLPDQFVFLETMPLNSAGKIDRSQLPYPEHTPADQPKQTPRTPQEEALCHIFSQVLEREVNDVHADFFNLGGHSLLAIKLLAMLEKSLGLKLPLVSLFEEATVASLAQKLMGHQEFLSPLIALRTTETRQPPLILIHPVGGNLLCYRSLLASGTFAQVWGFQSLGIAPDETPLDDLDAMAYTYAKKLQSTLPEGPYLLAGWSMGGVLALKMAAQLAPVAGVFMIDSFAPQFIDHKVDSLTEALILAGELSPFLGGHKLSKEILADIAPDQRNDWVLAQAAQASPTLDLSMLQRMAAVFNANQTALRKGHSEFYDGRVFLAEASAPVPEKRATQSWQQLLPNLSGCTYQGGHYDWFKPSNIARIEQAMRIFFDEASS